MIDDRERTLDRATDPSPSMRRCAGGAAATVVLAILGATWPAAGAAQDAALDPPAADGEQLDDAAARYPLIREGSRLVGVRGLVDRDPRLRTLRLTIDESDPQSPGHRLVLMPSSRLTELESVLGAAADARATMILTGRVFVFDGRNYLLLTHPAIPDERMLLDPATSPPETDGEAGTGGERDEADETSDTDTDTDPDSVDEISRDLERAVGPVGRRTLRGSRGVGPGERPASVNVGRLLPEGTRLVDRRGKIRRTPGGGFVFVFDADTDGASDPPMMLLPCRLLERLARVASNRGDEAAVLLSGEVTIHDGRNYLLPSVYRIPRELTRLTP